MGEVFSIKTPELRRQTIVAAMYGTFDKNETEARKFWREVGRGGVDFDDNHPTTVLDGFLKAVAEDKGKLDLRPPNFYQSSIYAWNAFREDKTITNGTTQKRASTLFCANFEFSIRGKKFWPWQGRGYAARKDVEILVPQGPAVVGFVSRAAVRSHCCFSMLSRDWKSIRLPP